MNPDQAAMEPTPAGTSRLGFRDAILAILLGCLALALRPPDRETALGLNYRPDALEYAVSALHLSAGHGFVLRIGEADYPPRYEPGFPFVLALWYRLGGREPENAAILMSLLSIGGVVLFYLAARKACGRASSAVMSALLALSPLQIELSRFVMSESLLFALGCAFLALVPSREPSQEGRWLAVGLVAGALGTVRPTCWLGALGVAILAWTQSRRAALLCSAGVAALLLPLLVFRTVRFGSPLASGYSYWLPTLDQELGPMFSASYLFHTRFGQGTLEYYLATLFRPRGGAWPWAAALLAALGCFHGLRSPTAARRLLGSAAAALAVPTATFLVYFWVDRRFLIAALPFLALAGGIGLQSLLGSRQPGRRWLAGVLAAGAIVQAVDGVASLAPRSHTWFEKELEGLRWIHRWVRPGDVLVSDTSQLLSTWEFPEARHVVAHLSLDEHLARIHGAKLEPLPGSRFDAGSWRLPVEPLFGGTCEPNRAALEDFAAAWRRGSKVLVLLTHQSDKLKRITRCLKPVRSRTVARNHDSVLLRLLPAGGKAGLPEPSPR